VASERKFLHSLLLLLCFLFTAANDKSRDEKVKSEKQQKCLPENSASFSFSSA